MFEGDNSAMRDSILPGEMLGGSSALYDQRHN